MKTNVVYITHREREVMMESFGMDKHTIDKKTNFYTLKQFIETSHYDLVYISPSVYRQFEKHWETYDDVAITVLDNTETPSHIGSKRMKKLLETSIGIQIR